VLAQSGDRFSEEIMLKHKGSDGSPAEDALGVTGEDVAPRYAAAVRFKNVQESKSPRPVSGAGFLLAMLNICR
jgi:hypothetical protein